MDHTETPEERRKNDENQRSRGAMITRLGVGAVFLITGVTTNWAEREDISNPVGTMLFAIILGLALIVWGLIPWFKARKKRAEEAAAQAAEEARRMNEPKICSACGATTKGTRCEYCGSPLK